MLEVRNLEHHYDGRCVLSVDALDVEDGTITALTGPNGSGKSTLLRLLAFVERPTTGSLYLNGQPVTTRGDRGRARRRVTLVEQQPLLFRGTVRQNIRYALRLNDVRGHEAERRIARSLERLEVANLAGRRARALSKGDIQRVAVARALALEPQVLLLDEPVSSADRGTTAQLFRVLQEERGHGTAILFASHQLEDAYRWSKLLVSLTGGRLGTLTPENLLRTVIPDGQGLRVVQAGPLQIHVVTDRSGPATILLPPNEITVSRKPLESSARNQFAGHVIRIGDDGRGGVTLHVDVGVDLSVRITRRALDELGITLGSRVVLSIKAMAVRVF